MSIDTLQDLYVHELQDNYSANGQMVKVVGELREKASDDQLRQMLDKSIVKIREHNERIADLVRAEGEDPTEEHCKGMEGLVKEARKHGIEESYGDPAVQDAAIIAQMQRMTHYGICGLGCAKAFAQALGKEDAVRELDRDLGDIYSGDTYLSRIAESKVNEDAAA
jgi:ferritin-like metal-binding protein YciE